MGEQEKRLHESVVSFGSYRLDAGNAQLWRGGQEVKLTGKAFTVLRYFVDHPGQLATKDDLFAAAWPETVVSEATLVSCIQELRQALRDDAKKPRYIETVHRRGYRFVATVAAPVPSSEFQVPSQNEVVSSQQSGTSTQEQTANGQVQEAYSLAATTNVPTLPSHASTPSRSRRGLAFLLGLLLLIGIVIAAEWRFVRSLNAPPALVTDSLALPLPEKPSIVILPFLNLTGDLTQEILGDGIVEGMTTGLAKLPGLFIISRASAFTYKGKAVQVRDVSRELGVRYVLEGSVQKVTNDYIRVTAQLVDATTDQLVWAEEYERPVEDIFAVRDDITRKLLTHIAPKITQMEQSRLERTYAGNLEAYDYFVRGSFSWQQGGDKEKNAEGRQLCQKAVEIDPNYAHAYACMGFTYWFDWLYGWTQDPQVLEHILASAHKALALDDSLPPAHELMGLHYLAKREYERALPEFQQAVELGPNWSSPNAGLGITLNATGRATEAIPLLEHVVRLNPRHPVWYSSYLAVLGNAYRLTGQYDKAIETLKKALSVNPWGGNPAMLWLVATYSESGNNEMAQVLASQFLQKVPQFSLATVQARHAFLYKDPAELEHFLAALRKAGLK